MTQDAQKFTEEDTRKASYLCGNVEHVNSHSLCDFCRPIAKALRDERNGLEDQVLHLNEFNVEAVERIKGLEDRVRLAEAEIKSRIEQHDFQLEARENMIAFNNDRLKALEAENENAKFSFDALVKKYEAILYENSKMMLTYNDECKKYEAEVARLKEEVDRVIWDSKKSDEIYLATIRMKEARLAEAMRVLEWIAKASYENSQSPARHAAHEFLQSPTNSEAQERQRAKDKVVDVARLFHKTNELKDHTALGKALDSLPSEARGGCLHDNGFTYQKGLSVFDKDDKGCPFCDKKTGGVSNV